MRERTANVLSVLIWIFWMASVGCATVGWAVNYKKGMDLTLQVAKLKEENAKLKATNSAFEAGLAVKLDYKKTHKPVLLNGRMIVIFRGEEE